MEMRHQTGKITCIKIVEKRDGNLVGSRLKGIVSDVALFAKVRLAIVRQSSAQCAHLTKLLPNVKEFGEQDSRATLAKRFPHGCIATEIEPVN
ncbi:hypothetical protein ElyMa_004441200 [Elysia marginata]|uniref:Uncharacterized protein n=1 Tax=Elysia marginata TaxID=1093978 RepID=A0AAV4HCN3_9GAST|nr:hypothetical protein ElyMa_004441200 [Elysia marginata]